MTWACQDFLRNYQKCYKDMLPFCQSTFRKYGYNFLQIIYRSSHIYIEYELYFGIYKSAINYNMFQEFQKDLSKWKDKYFK